MVRGIYLAKKITIFYVEITSGVPVGNLLSFGVSTNVSTTFYDEISYI